MQFLNSLFADNKLLTLGAAIAAFLVFAVLVLLFVRLLFGNRLRMSSGRGRQQRLGVVDAYDMDRQRQLVLVRRDNTEHLILIGGPNDVLIESAIIRIEGRERAAPAARETAPVEPARLPVPDTWTAAPPAPMPPTMPAPAAAPAPEIAASSSSPLSPPLPAPAPPEPVAPPKAPAPPLVADAAPAPARTDIFSRLRSQPTPAPVAPAEPVPIPPPEAPPVPAPPVADADFFETEIAKALAPSVRERPDGPPPPLVEPEARDVPDAPAPAAETKAPSVRPPFRPFTPPPRRDAGALSAGAGLRPVGSRPPPPPFFSRMTPRPKESVEPTAPPSPMRDDTSDAPKSPVETPAVAHEPAPSPAAAHEPAPVPHDEPAAAPVPPAPVPPPPVAEAIDPFEEEMARLLGRAPAKDG